MSFSHHSHSGEFCFHAQNTLEEMVVKAISLKMRTFALTEHVPRSQADLYPEEIHHGQTEKGLFDLFDRYYIEALRLREKYKSDIDILIGFESEWIRTTSRQIVESLLRKYHFDMFIGSIHHVHTIPIDWDVSQYHTAVALSGGTTGQLFCQYFDDQFEMLQVLKPPIVGHFDLIRLNSKDPGMSLKAWPTIWARVVRNLQFIAEYGGLIELNSAAIRKGLKEPYPSGEICQEFLILGGKFTLSDDSHAVEHIGSEFERTIRFAVQIGIRDIYFFQKTTQIANTRVPNLSILNVSTAELLLLYKN